MMVMVDALEDKTRTANATRRPADPPTNLPTDPPTNQPTRRPTTISSGKFSNTTGATACDDCPAGKYAISAGLSECTVCNKGTYSERAQSECKTCSVTAGEQYTSDEGSAFCNRCAKTYYWDDIECDVANLSR